MRKQNKDLKLEVRCTPSEKSRYQRKAKRLNLSLSEFIRRALNREPLPVPRDRGAAIARQQITYLELAKLEATRIGNDKLLHFINQSLQATAQLLQ